tara:strand:- start:1890 stop:2375 length:486 start_codon:yes stop_codon:yes gene_type:complete
MNSYLKNKLLFKLNNNEFVKIENECNEISFGKVSLFSINFLKLLIILLINFKFVSLAKIFLASILNYYEQFNFMNYNYKLIGYAFIQKTKKKYFFMNKNDCMLGEIYVSKSFRNKNLATKMSLCLLNKNHKYYKNIFYVCDKNNIASIKLAKKCGFENSKY